ncbi:hypothetical protein ACP70R_020964 [Stipagrostis hirtigluma subsp. patula]
MATNSTGQSKGSKAKESKEDEYGKKYISYTLLSPELSHSTERATCRVKIPSDDLSAAYDPPASVDQSVVLVVKNASDIHCIKLMRDCVHTNILHAVAFAEKDSYIQVWTEQYSDQLVTYLESTAFWTSNIKKVSGQELMLPTNIQNIISQIFDGFEQLRLIGKYHGNFKLDNTYYHKVGREIVVKLTDFKLKDARIPAATHQAHDVQAVGVGLEYISKTAKARKGKGQTFDCHLIDDLAKRLREFVGGDLPYINQEIKGHPFFWDKKSTKMFFVSEVPLALNSPATRAKIAGCNKLCSLPWGTGTDGYSGYVKLMDDYRSRNKLDNYDKTSRLGYVQFLSGLYTHEHELQGGVSVDDVVREKNPRIFLILYDLIPREREAPN